jgi:hypothetical protein
MWLACFLGSLAALGTLHAAYALAVALRLLRPRLHSPTAGARQAWSIVLLNSVNLAVACSVYYSFCGNAPRGPAPPHAGGLKEAVCHKWLHPVSASSHSAFTRWVIYGEAAANRTAAVNGGPAPPATRLWGGAPPPRVPAAAAASFIQVDFPLDGKVGGRMGVWGGEAGGVLLLRWGGRRSWALAAASAGAHSHEAVPPPSHTHTHETHPRTRQGLLPVPADDLVSPIFTMWVTLLLMYAANCLADYAAAATLRAAYTADMRRGEGEGGGGAASASVGCGGYRGWGCLWPGCAVFVCALVVCLGSIQGQRCFRRAVGVGGSVSCNPAWCASSTPPPPPSRAGRPAAQPAAAPASPQRRLRARPACRGPLGLLGRRRRWGGRRSSRRARRAVQPGCPRLL